MSWKRSIGGGLLLDSITLSTVERRGNRDANRQYRRASTSSHRSLIRDMTIRRALDGDRPLLLDLWERSVRVTHDFLSERDIATLKPLVATALTSDALEWWVAATESDEPIAFLGYSTGTIDALFVDPRHRGSGVGTRLVAHAQHLAGGALRVDVNEQNEAARGFYASLGFEVVGRSPTDDGGRPFPMIHMMRPAPR